MLALHIQRYPVPELGAASWELVGGPDGAKLLGLAATLAWLGALNLAAWGASAPLERALPLPRALVDLRPVLRLALGLGAIALGVLLLALGGALQRPVLALAIAGPALLWLGSALRRGARGDAGGAGWPRPWAVALAALLLAQAFVDALGPDPGWDALTYHLALPERYLFENGVAVTPFSHLSGYAMSTQMLYLLALGTGGVDLAVLLHFEFGVLLLFALARLAARFSTRAALLAPLVMLADPLFQTELGWAYADLALALYATLAVAAFDAWLEDPDDRRALIYAGLACGLCGATRYLGVLVMGSLWVRLWLPPRHRRVRENLHACLLSGAVAAAVVLPWLLRNAIFTGNPVTPFLQSVFHAPGREFIDPLVLEQSTAWVRSIGMGRDGWALLRLPWNLSMESKPGLYTDSFGFQVGPLYALGVLAALSIGGLRRHPAVATLLWLIGLQTLAWFFTLQEPRFLLPTFALAAWVGGVAFDRLASQWRWGAAILALPVLAALYAQLLRLPSLPEEYAIALGGAPSDYYERADPVRRAAALLRRDADRDGRVLLLFERRGYLFHGLDYIPYHGASGSPVLQLVHRQPDPQALHCELQARGVSHVFLNRSAMRARPVFLPRYTRRDYQADLERLEALLRDRAEPRFAEGGAELFRLRPAACGPGT